MEGKRCPLTPGFNLEFVARSWQAKNYLLYDVGDSDMCAFPHTLVVSTKVPSLTTHLYKNESVTGLKSSSDDAQFHT